VGLEEKKMKINKAIIQYYKGKLDFEPYSYQTKLAETLLKGKNVILAVPTGAGKTWASIMPFLYAQETPEIHFPKKMIYSLPLRALANSIYQDVSKVTDASIQTGEFSEDKYFEKDIIFSTIDQTLSNFLCFPLPLSSRQANINAGALVGSYLVFDEFHLLDEERSMATTLGGLRILGNLCRCCIMTATLSNDYMEALKENLPNYEIITLDEFPEDKDNISSLLPKENKKKIEVSELTISAKSIAEKHDKKTIVICNRVETAQKLYQGLTQDLSGFQNLTGLKEGNIICLHSRFFDKDRKEKEGRLKGLFGKEADENEQAILISTQVIEAGMDISCKVMHTEISPINSFLQRVGRCARFKDEKGEIFIYDVLDSEEKEKIRIEPENKEDKDEIRKLNNKYLPYDKDICLSTFKALQEYITLDGNIPQKLIEEVLKEKEQRIIEQLKQGNFNHNKILSSWSDCKKNNYRNTVRDIQSVEITIINDEQLENVKKYPYRYQSLGMYKFSLVSWLNKIAKGNEETPPPKLLEADDWLVKALTEANDIFLENDENEKWELKTIPVDEFKNVPTQVYVNAKYFGYEKSFGFNWQYQDTFNNISTKREYKDKEDEFKPLKKDTFYQHNKALIGVFEQEFLGEKQDKLDFIFKELALFIGREDLQKSDFIRLVKLMIVLHDYGKLNDKWQKPMQEYQALKEGINLRDFKEVLGHTDYDSNDENDKKLGQKAKLHTRPPHAGVGAYIAQEILEDEYDNEYITSGISMAIARHHSPLSSSSPDFKISDSNYQAMQKILDEFDLDFDLEQEEDEGVLEGFEYDDWEKEQIVYLYFARILRLCDQKATENFEKYFKEKNHV
jgi:CRISPR-associated endonuclease/helicase Cas3